MSESGIAEPQPHVTVAEPSDDMKLKLAEREGQYRAKARLRPFRGGAWPAIGGQDAHARRSASHRHHHQTAGVVTKKADV